MLNIEVSTCECERNLGIIWGHHPGAGVLDTPVLSILWAKTDKGDYMMETQKSAQPPTDLDVCIHYTLGELKQNQSRFVSRSPLEYLTVWCFFSYASQRAGVHPTEKWAKSCAPVSLCSKGISPWPNPPDGFQPLC